MKNHLLVAFLTAVFGAGAVADEVADLVWRSVDGSERDSAEARRDLLGRGIPARRLVEALRAGRPGLETFQPGGLEFAIPRPDGGTDPCYVEIPEGYDPSKPAPLLFWLHGIGGNGRDIRRALQDVARRRGTIVACPFAGRWGKIPQTWEPGEDQVALRTLRELHRRLAIDPDRVWLFGVSLGGFGAWEIGLVHPDRFAALVTVAGGLSFLEYTGLEDPIQRRRLANARNLPVYMAHGSDDAVVPVRFDRKTKADLEALGYAFDYREQDGRGHLPPPKEELDRLVEELLDWLADRRRDPWPEEVVRVAFRSDVDVGCWVSIDRADWRGGRVRARRRPGNAFEVEASGATRIALDLSSDVVDLSAPVRVECGGRVVFEGLVPSDPALVLDEARRRGEGRRVAEARLRIDLPESGR